MIDRWGALVGRRALAVLLIGVLFTLGAGAFGAGVFDSLSQGGFDDASSESARELDAEREALEIAREDAIDFLDDPPALPAESIELAPSPAPPPPPAYPGSLAIGSLKGQPQ